MSYRRNVLLAGTAALALVMGTVLASAQEPSKEPGAQAQQPRAVQQTNQRPAAGKLGQSAQQGGATKLDQRAEQTKQVDKVKTGENRAAQNRAQKNAAMTQRNEKHANRITAERNKSVHHYATAQERNRTARRMAQEHRRFGNQNRAAAQNHNGAATTAAQRERNGMEGLQSNATGMNVPLSNEQRTRIRSTVIDARGAPRVGNVDFDVTVGTVIPRGRIHVVPVPPTLVTIEPAWRGFLYFVYEDEVVIVNPHTMRIVAVVPA